MGRGGGRLSTLDVQGEISNGSKHDLTEVIPPPPQAEAANAV